MFSVAFLLTPSLLTPRMTRPWAPGFSLALILLPGLAFAQTQQVGLFPDANKAALPQLSDGLGWKQPMYYSTIQTADIDGGGQVEVLARWIDGLHIYRFEKGTLLAHSRISALSDNDGFYEPSWYSTIQTAVLDRRLGQADVIARKRDGMHVFRYDSTQRQWRELGPNANVRPFADQDPGGTDWSQPKHYLTIQTADLTRDGVAELIGRGQTGLQVWRWNSADESWAHAPSGGELSDSNGFDQEPYYYSIQPVDVDHDGVAELIARAPAGVQTYKFSSSGWTRVSSNGPFRDDPGFLTDKRYKSIRASVDATGRAWLYGLAAGTDGAGSGAIQIHLWNDDHWQLAQTLRLPSSDWDRESQFATLMAADIQGDAQPEFLVRGPSGLQAYSLRGDRLPVHSQSFTDAQGWNLAGSYSTLQTAVATVTENGRSRARTLVLGRGSKGLEAYKFTDRWETAADSNFPQYCSNFNSDTSPKCLAYKAISGRAITGQVDIRTQYTRASFDSGHWTDSQNAVNGMTNPYGPNTDANWQAVQTEMVQELGWVATVRGWFDNNYKVLDDNYNRSADLLGQAVGDVAFAATKSVNVKWIEMAADIASKLAAFIPQGGGAGIGLMIAIFEEAYHNLAASNGDINRAITQIYDDLNEQKGNLNTTNATQQTAYLTDYSKLQQIGKDSLTGGYDWSKASLDDIANAKNGAGQGMLVNFYRTLVPYKWYAYWCSHIQYGGSCGSRSTEPQYDCNYGERERPSDNFGRQAYIYAGWDYDVNWDLADKLTGTGKEDVNAIWYMMLLGGDAGWDVPGYDYTTGRYVSDPGLSWDNLRTGARGVPRQGCDGNGSTTGIQNSFQTLSQRLTMAQQNLRRIHVSDVDGILEGMRRLQKQSSAFSRESNVEIELTSPLREAANLIERLDMRRGPSEQASVSATTPTHLLELFSQRVRLHARDLGEPFTELLLIGAYRLIGELEGQNQQGKAAVTRRGR